MIHAKKGDGKLRETLDVPLLNIYCPREGKMFGNHLNKPDLHYRKYEIMLQIHETTITFS